MVCEMCGKYIGKNMTNLEVILGCYVEAIKRTDNEEIIERYKPSFRTALSQYRLKEPQKADVILVEYTKVMRWKKDNGYKTYVEHVQ